MERSSCSFLFSLLMALIVSACATSKTKLAAPQTALKGDVQYVVDYVPEDSRYKLLEGITFGLAAPLDNQKPVYPAKLLSRRLPPVTVSVKIVVDARGDVTSVTPLNADAVPHEFVEATVATVSKWAFAPLEKFDGHVYEKLPFSETYKFVFSQKDGKASVE